jgi:hypothetical protein
VERRARSSRAARPARVAALAAGRAGGVALTCPDGHLPAASWLAGRSTDIARKRWAGPTDSGTPPPPGPVFLVFPAPEPAGFRICAAGNHRPFPNCPCPSCNCTPVTGNGRPGRRRTGQGRARRPAGGPARPMTNPGSILYCGLICASRSLRAAGDALPSLLAPWRSFVAPRRSSGKQRGGPPRAPVGSADRVRGRRRRRPDGRRLRCLISGLISSRSRAGAGPCSGAAAWTATASPAGGSAPGSGPGPCRSRPACAGSRRTGRTAWP